MATQSGRTVFLDVDTQLDFLLPAGALAVPGAEMLVPALASLTRFAAANGILILSTADAHAEDDAEFKSWKPHCVVGTTGQTKSAATLLTPNPLVLTTDHDAWELIRDEVPRASQIIVEKQKLDVFTNPNLPLLLQALQAHRIHCLWSRHRVLRRFRRSRIVEGRSACRACY